MKEVGIYVHIPFCASKCKYCSFFSTVNFSMQDAYINALTGEIESGKTDDLITSVYVGGGTPSVLKTGHLTTIFNKIRANFNLSADCEITVEANPESATNQFLQECKTSGVNRLSLGLQCADDQILSAIGRGHKTEDFISAVSKARSYGIDNISGDLIIGLENEDDAVIIRSLQLLDSLGIDHVSVYSLSVEKGSVMFSKTYRPDEDKMADQYDLCCEFLRKAGYERYEISNFAKNGKQSRHNNKYWKLIDYIGFGASAHSCYNGVRYANVSSISKYINGERRVDSQTLTEEDCKTEYVMLGLRLSDGISLGEYEKRFGCDLLEDKKKQIEMLTKSEAVEIVGDRLRVTDKGAYVLNYIITELI